MLTSSLHTHPASIDNFTNGFKGFWNIRQIESSQGGREKRNLTSKGLFSKILFVMLFNRATSVWTNIVCIKYYELSVFLCYNFYIDGNIPFWVLWVESLYSCFTFYYCQMYKIPFPQYNCKNLLRLLQLKMK